MIVLGLTGSIAMGKSTVTAQFASLGAVVHNADLAVHRLLGRRGKAVQPVAALFPEAYAAGVIDRKTLGAIVFNDYQKLHALEKILHPLVKQEERQVVRSAKALGARVAVLDIPLLFETGAESRVDQTIVVTAPAFLQRQRAFQRSGVTEEKFRHILSLQMPDREKQHRADFIIPTGLGRAYSFQCAKAIMEAL